MDALLVAMFQHPLHWHISMPPGGVHPIGYVLINDDVGQKRLTIGGLLDLAEVDYRDETYGDLVISWYFSRMFTRVAAASDHWAIIDRHTAFRLKSRYSMLLFQHISSLVKQAHVTRKVFTVSELRAVLGVGAGKLDRFANLNARAIQPAIDEISAESRFVLIATPRKSGRTIVSIEIEWFEKSGDERKLLKAEMDRHSSGRKACRERATETVAVAFPATGGIAYSPYWLESKQAAGCNADNAKIAADFRRFLLERGIARDATNIKKTFEDFCRKVGKV